MIGIQLKLTQILKVFNCKLLFLNDNPIIHDCSLAELTEQQRDLVVSLNKGFSNDVNMSLKSARIFKNLKQISFHNYSHQLKSFEIPNELEKIETIYINPRLEVIINDDFKIGNYKGQQILLECMNNEFELQSLL